MIKENMSNKEIADGLAQYQRWRRGEEDWAPDERGPDPKELGQLLDLAIERLRAENPPRCFLCRVAAGKSGTGSSDKRAPGF